MDLDQQKDIGIAQPQQMGGIFIDRDQSRATDIIDEFNYKINRESHFVELNRKLFDIYKKDITYEEQKEQAKKEQITSQYKMNLVGYMLSKMSWHSENLVDIMLSKIMADLQATSDGDDDD